MDKLSTSTNANYCNMDGTTSFEAPIYAPPKVPIDPPSCSTGDDATVRDGFDAAPGAHDARADHALQIVLTAGSKVSSGAGFAMRVAGIAAGPSTYATAAEAAELLPLSTALKTAGQFARIGGAALAGAAGAVQVYSGYTQHNTRDEVFGALKIGAAAVTAINPPLGLAAGVGIYIAEQVTNHVSAGKNE